MKEGQIGVVPGIKSVHLAPIYSLLCPVFNGAGDDTRLATGAAVEVQNKSRRHLSSLLIIGIDHYLTAVLFILGVGIQVPLNLMGSGFYERFFLFVDAGQF